MIPGAVALIKLMHTLKYFLGMSLLVFATNADAASWLTDLNAAQAQARKEGKFVMVNFTGSDWCQWCIKLQKEVFSQPEFESFASKNLVLVEVDFPKRKPQSPAVQKVNGALVAHYKIDGFPTLIFLNSQGKLVHRGGYVEGGAKPFLSDVTRSLGMVSEPPPTVVVQARPRPAPEPVKELPLYGGAPPAPQQRYTEFVLKNISGTKSRRFALLNNQTLGVGETGRVQFGDTEVKVRCLEIRERSVVIAVDGQEGSREVFLKNRPAD
jgi:thioredoxin-related protein